MIFLRGDKAKKNGGVLQVLFNLAIKKIKGESAMIIIFYSRYLKAE